MPKPSEESLIADSYAHGGLLVAMSYGAYMDGMGRSEDRLWGAMGMSVAAAMLTAGVSAGTYLMGRRRFLIRTAVVLSWISLAGNFGLAVAGMQLVAAAQRRGGDWGGLAVAAAWAFGIYFPLILAVIGIAFHFRLRLLVHGE